MARARNIKPGFFTNDVLAEVDPLGRILFAGLWTIADREGRLEDRPKKIKAQILPYDDCNCDELLQDLHKYGFILRYELNGNQYIQIIKWAEHQNPHVKEADSTIPAPDKNSASTVQAQEKTETSRADSLNPITDSLNPHTSSKPAARGDEYSDEFEEAWEIYPSRPGASKRETFQAWNARLKAGVGVSVLLAGTRRYAAYVKAMGTEPQYIKQPKSFFGPGEHYLADWTPSAKARASPPYQTKHDQTKAIVDALTGNRNDQRTPSADIIDIN
ncbi:MAG: hypothetical protein ACM34A_12115 [Bacillota bacterium]